MEPKTHPGYILDSHLYYGKDKPDPKTSIHLLLEEGFNASGFEGYVEFKMEKGLCSIITRFERIK